jgi:hypothetical protein
MRHRVQAFFAKVTRGPVRVIVDTDADFDREADTLLRV